MNNIVVAIDFSESSINAFLHALSIAQKCNTDLDLVWVRKSTEEQDKFDNKGDPTKEVTVQFTELITKYQPELPGNKINYKIRTGKVYKEITDEARESKAMLVVAGTHGASVFVEFWIGSNANRIISLSPCPVITIRSGINIARPLSRIVLPIDSTAETRQKATFTGYLAKKHDAQIHILSLYRTKVKAMRRNIDSYSEQVAKYFEEKGIKYLITSTEADNIADSIIKYGKSVDANLISIMTHQESSTANLWMGPFAQQTVNRSPIPVLCIRPKETLAAGLGF
ncbi:MAG: universal stress protein [Bacteroidales bacterium]|jgi:nucleotide-binding universal stress UspA family protein